MVLFVLPYAVKILSFREQGWAGVRCPCLILAELTYPWACGQLASLAGRGVGNRGGG